MKKALFLLAFVISLAPFAAWAIYKPSRVLAPELVEGIFCVDSKICIEDKSKYLEASTLYESALIFVTEAVGSFQKNPRIIFCSSEVCFQSFGFNKSSASTVGKSGIVISPRGWEAHYLSHEMIHHRQAEELGVFAMLLDPEWLIEGMAYSLSDDPRNSLSDRWQQVRVKFEGWYMKVGKINLWEEAGRI